MPKALPTVQVLKQIAKHFKLDGEVAQILPYGSGHINDSYHIINSDKSHPDYLLQRVNDYVFKDVPLLINNINLVTRHIKAKLISIGGANTNQKVLTLVKTRDDLYYYIDNEHNYWRVYIFLKNTVSYDLVSTVNQANQGGKAFGFFQYLISDLNVGLIGESISNFHNIEFRLQKFDEVLLADRKKRASRIPAEIAFISDRKKAMCGILDMGRAGKIPIRITHNDTKFNNVLLDKDDHAQCVIDLDTVMPGYIAYDFGDAIRTIINTCAEDEIDISKIDIKIELYKAFTDGFLKETAPYLTKDEIISLPMGALLFPYMIGVRFLTDYLDGDKYFKIKSTDHNLQRARVQFQLLKKMEEQYPILQSIVKELAKKYNNPVSTYN